MTFSIFTIARKKSNKVEIHTPSCSRTDRLKKRGMPLHKVQAQYVEEASTAAQTLNGKANLAIRPIVHERCCKLFHKPANNNPPCPHCKSASTVFASNIGVGKREFSCTSCKKLFIVNKTKGDRAMKIRIHKNSASKVRADKRAERLAAREARRAERKATRVVRIGARLRKIAARLEKLGVGVTNLVLFTDSIAPVVKAAKVARKGKAVKTAATASAKKTAAKAGKPAAKKAVKKTAAKKGSAKK